MLLRISTLVALVLVTFGCQSGPSAEELGRSTTTAGMVTFRDFNTGSSMTIISESMLEQLGVEGATPEERTANFFSQERSNANTKVSPDDAVTGLTKYLEDNGFAKWSAAGEAPGRPVNSRQWIQWQVGDSVMHMENPTGANADPKAKSSFIEFVQVFLNVYNVLPQHQSVEGFEGFEQPTLSDQQLQKLNGRGIR